MGREWGRENQRWSRADRAALVAGALHKGVDERGVVNKAGKGTHRWGRHSAKTGPILWLTGRSWVPWLSAVGLCNLV